MHETTVNKTQTDKRLQQIKGVLYSLDLSVDDLKKEIADSEALLKIGKKTKLVNALEKVMDNPMKGLFDVSQSFDESIHNILHTLVVAHFKSLEIQIKSIFRAFTPSNDLYYYIVPIEDTFEFRNQIFTFFNHYDLSEISNKYPVYFQVVPPTPECEKGISHMDEISL